MAYFRKESPKFDGENYLDWKNKMVTHLQCIGFEVFDVTIKAAKIPTLEDLAKDDATKRKNELFHQNVIAKEPLISALSDSEFFRDKEGRHCPQDMEVPSRHI